jgi:hypothetical protein
MDLASIRMILPNWLMTMSSLVSSTELMQEPLPTLRVAFLSMTPSPRRNWSRYWSTPVHLPYPFPETDRDEAEPNSQNGNPSKIHPEKVACFSSPKTDRQLPSFHQQSTTTSPAKNHVQPPVFTKTPSKNRVPPSPKNYCRSTPLRAGFCVLRGMTTVAATLSCFEVEDTIKVDFLLNSRLRRGSSQPTRC